MKLKKIDHIGVVVNDMEAAKAFFVEFGLEVLGEAINEGAWVDRVAGLEGIKAAIAVLRPPEGGVGIELIKYYNPLPENAPETRYSNTPGISNICFVVDDIDAVVAGMAAKGYHTLASVEQYEDIYKLCYVRGPEGIIVMLAQELK